MTWVNIFGILLSVVALLLTFIVLAWLGGNQRRVLRVKGVQTTEERIGRLSSSLQEAVRLIDEMQQEISARSKVVDKLQQDVERYNSLIKLKKPEVEAVAQQLREEIRSEGQQSFRKNFLVAALFFVLGVVATVGVSLVFR